jgi:hypothetical protein
MSAAHGPQALPWDCGNAFLWRSMRAFSSGACSVSMAHIKGNTVCSTAHSHRLQQQLFSSQCLVECRAQGCWLGEEAPSVATCSSVANVGMEWCTVSGVCGHKADKQCSQQRGQEFHRFLLHAVLHLALLFKQPSKVGWCCCMTVKVVKQSSKPSTVSFHCLTVHKLQCLCLVCTSRTCSDRDRLVNPIHSVFPFLSCLGVQGAGHSIHSLLACALFITCWLQCPWLEGDCHCFLQLHVVVKPAMVGSLLTTTLTALLNDSHFFAVDEPGLLVSCTYKRLADIL